MVDSKEVVNAAHIRAARERLIVALDFHTADDALRMIDKLEDHIEFYKVGLEMLVSVGPDFWKDLISRHKRVFLDVKMWDIDNTIERTVRRIADMGIEFLTLHENGATTKAALRGRGTSPKPKLLSITYLSSLDQSDLMELQDRNDLTEYIRERATHVLDNGCDGLIASGSSVADLRTFLKDRTPRPIIVVPGIRPTWSQSNDHKRTLTPKQAIQDGADFLVVGRPITKAPTPIEAADRIVAEMAEVR